MLTNMNVSISTADTMVNAIPSTHGLDISSFPS
jgi:hypothetical protein